MNQTAEQTTMNAEQVLNATTTSKVVRIKVEKQDIDTAIIDDLAIQVHTTIVDKLSGVTDVEPVWRKAVSSTYLTRLLEEITVRQEVSSFFMSLSLGPVLRDAITTRTVKKGDKILLTQDLAKAVNSAKALSSPAAKLVTTELVNAYLTRVGIVPENEGGYGNLVYYVPGAITITKLERDILGQELLRMVDSIELVDLEKNTYTPAVFANEVALAMEDVGRVLTDAHEMNTLVMDIVRGVRARIDPNLVGMRGSCPSDWRESTIVKEASRNYVFIRAALELPIGTNMTPVNNEYRLDKFGGTVWTALKMSTRYRFVSREEAIRTRGLRVVRDAFGDVRVAVVWDAARPDAIAQVVQAERDARIPSAVRVTNERTRVADGVKLAYGDTQAMGTTAAVGALVTALRYKIEAEVEERGDAYNDAAVYWCSVGDANSIAREELAALLCERVYIKPNISEDPLDATESATMMASALYSCATREKFVPAGVVLGGMFFTREAADVFLAYPEFEPRAELGGMPQIIPKHGLDASLIGLDESKRFRKLGHRVSFAFKIDDIEVQGALNANKLNTISTSDLLSIVKPMFNNDVLGAVVDIVSHIVELADVTKRKNSPLQAVLANHAAATVLGLARATSADFRGQVAGLIKAQAGGKLPANAAARLGGLLNDRAHRVTAETVAMFMFLDMQGLDCADAYRACANNANVVLALPKIADIKLA